MQTSTQVGGRTWPPVEQGAGAEVSQQSCPWLTKQKKQKTKKDLDTSVTPVCPLRLHYIHSLKAVRM